MDKTAKLVKAHLEGKVTTASKQIFANIEKQLSALGAQIKRINVE